MEKLKLSRRDFIKISVAVGGGLVVGFQLPSCAKEKINLGLAPNPNKRGTQASVALNAWIAIGTDDRVLIKVASSEMGQGIMTGIAMLVAEELNVDWNQVHAEFAPAHEQYYNPLMGAQGTGGSTAIRGFWNVTRKAAALAREVLIQAAANRWNISASRCITEQGKVVHKNKNQTLRYGELVADAAKLPVPASIWLKEPSEFKLLGKPLPRLDGPEKVDGSAKFGMDVELPGMLNATVIRCPVIGGKVKSFDASSTLKIPGVKRVIQISQGIAVIADFFWNAKLGRDVLKIEWDYGKNKDLDSGKIFAQFAAAANNGGLVENQSGDFEEGLKSSHKTIDAIYVAPYQAHACMEPMNATADVRTDRCDIYAPTQSQTETQNTGMHLCRLPREKVFVHTTFLGGGFGRRAEQDFISDAVECSKAIGKPVKVLWTREDDLMHDQYRPASYNILRGGIDKQGQIVAWEHRIAGSSILARRAPKSRAAKSGRDPTSTEGATNIPYNIKNFKVSYAMVNPGIPVGFWRSVGSSQNAFVTECFIDELAALAQLDPLQIRLKHMAAHPRHVGVLKLAAEKAQWSSPPAAGRGRGIAAAESFGSYVAQVAEVSVKNGQVRVHRVVCAIDCGMIVNPDTVRAQMESGIIYGLTATLKSAITIKGGQVEQTNFDRFELLRIDECPEIEVHIVKSTEEPGGVGEPGVPPIAPAVANAVFALTKKPVRSLPIRV